MSPFNEKEVCKISKAEFDKLLSKLKDLADENVSFKNKVESLEKQVFSSKL